MYIGKQKILKEEPLEGNYVKVTLKPAEVDRLEQAEEEVVYDKTILSNIRSKEQNGDDTDLRNKRCEKVIEDIVLVLLRNNTQLHDLRHIFENASETVNQAKLKLERKMYGNNEYKRTVYQLVDQLLQSN